MKLLLPNNPVRVGVKLLLELCDKELSKGSKRKAQDKWDGWRRPAYKIDGKWVFQSKGTGAEAVVPIPPGLVAELEELFQDLDNIAIDMEWIGPRNKEALREFYGHEYHGFRIFDLTYLNGAWIGKMPFGQRWETMSTIYELCRAKRPHAAKRIELVRTWDTDWDKMFEESKNNPLLEGIVLKRSDSPLLAKSKNPFWYKIKYRDIHEETAF